MFSNISRIASICCRPILFRATRDAQVDTSWRHPRSYDAAHGPVARSPCYALSAVLSGRILCIGVALSSLVSCHERPEAVYPITGPDGSPMVHISCGDRPGRCYQIAGQVCPYGYDLFPTVIDSQTDVLAKCVRAPAEATKQAAAATTNSGSPSPLVTVDPGLPPLRGKGAGDTWVDSTEVETPNPWPPDSKANETPWPPRSEESLAQPWPEAYQYRK